MTIKRNWVLVAIAMLFVTASLVAFLARGDGRPRVDVLDHAGKVVGWAYETELAPSLPDPTEAKANFDIGQRVEVHGSKGEVVGFIVRGTGFVPLDRSP